MVALSPKALRLINAAVDLHAQSPERERWISWKEGHPGIRHREDGQRDIREPAAVPEDVIVIILSALKSREGQLRNELEGCPDWDEYKISELDNQLSFLLSVARFIESAPRKARREGWLRLNIMGR